MKRVYWAHAATRDLRNLETYLRSYDPDIAQDHVERVVLATYWLLENPNGGPRLGRGARRKWTPPGQRKAVILYKPTRDGISVLRVRHARSNWRKD